MPVCSISSLACDSGINPLYGFKNSCAFSNNSQDSRISGLKLSRALAIVVSSFPDSFKAPISDAVNPSSSPISAVFLPLSIASAIFAASPIPAAVSRARVSCANRISLQIADNSFAAIALLPAIFAIAPGTRRSIPSLPTAYPESSPLFFR